MQVLLRASDSLSARYSTSTETARGFLEEEEDVKHSAFPPPPEHILSRLGSLELLDAFSMERCEETDTVQTERKNLLGPETRALGLEFRMEKSENECSALESASLCQDGSQSRLVLPSVPIPLQSTETAHSEAKGLKEMDLATQVYFLAQRLGITEKQLLTQKAFMMSNNSTEFDTETPQRALIQIWRKRVYALLLERVSMKAAASKERSDWASERSALDKENARLSRQIADNSVSQYQLHQRLKDVESREAASQVLEERLLAVTKRLERSVLE